MEIRKLVSTVTDTEGEDTWITVKVAADFSGLSEEYLRRVARDGKIQSKSNGLGRPKLMLLSSVQAFRDQQDQSGPQKHSYCRNVSDEQPNADLPDLLTSPAQHLITSQADDDGGAIRVLPARYILTDDMTILLNSTTSRSTGVLLMTEIKADAVRAMLNSPEIKDQRILPFFSSSAAASLVLAQLRLQLNHSARVPQIVPGDNVIQAVIKPGLHKANVKFYLMRLAI